MVVEASSYRATSAEEAMNKELVTFIYAGQGSEWHGMGVSAYAAGGAFRETIDRLAAQLKTGDGYGSSSHTRVGGRVLADKLLKVFEEGAHHGDCHGIALIAYQLAATNALRAAGVAPPTAVLGYSLGEVAAGYCAGALTESQALAVACARAQLVEEVAPEGAMAVAGLSKKAFNNLCKEGTTPSETSECPLPCRHIHNIPFI
jgi:acyl transferase domain-containing protein